MRVHFASRSERARRSAREAAGRRLLRVVASALVALLALLGVGATRAFAADIGSQLTNIELNVVGSPVTVHAGWGEEVCVTFDADVPASANAGDTWQLTLPTLVDPTTWPATATDPFGNVNVTIAGGVATFVLTPQGADATNLRFHSEFCGTVLNTVTVGTYTLQVTIAGQTISGGTVVVVPGNGSLPTDPLKSMWFKDSSDQCRTNTDGCLVLDLYTAPGDTGQVTFVDTADTSSFTFDCVNAYNPGSTDWVRIQTLDSSGNVSTDVPAPSRQVSWSCSSGSLTAVVDTAGLNANQRIAVGPMAVSAVQPGLYGGISYDNTADVSWNSGTTQIVSHTESATAIVVTSGDHIQIIKQDVDGNDANDPASAVELPSGTVNLEFTVLNTGTTTLNNVTVTDVVVTGPGTVSAISCPTSTLASGHWMVCTATLTGVSGDHKDTATATGIGNATVSDTDDYHAHTPPTEVEVTPSASVTPVCGADNDVVTAGPTTGVDYAVSGWSNGVNTVTATPQAGYVFPAGAQASWTFTDTEIDGCTEVTPSASVTPVCGPDNDMVTAGPTTGVDYAVSGWSNGVYTVTATPQAGYAFPAGAVTFWSFTDDNVPCEEEVIPAEPTVAPVCGADNDVVTAGPTTGVDYAVSGWSNGVNTVTATPQAGYVFPLGAQTSWTFYDTELEGCTEVTPVAPTVTPVCGPDNDIIDPPVITGVAWSWTGWFNGEFVITAIAEPGFTFPAGAQTSWTFTDDNVPCEEEVIPAEPTVAPVCGPDNDVVTAGPTTGVDYAVSGWSNGVYTVTATPQAGYVFPAGATTSWTFNDTEVEGCTEVTPAASVAPVCGPDNDVVTAGPTTGVDYAVSGWSNGVYTVTATPQAGYVFPAGAVTFWSFTDDNVPCDQEVTPAEPTVAPVCGADNDVVTAGPTTGVDYAVSGWSNGVNTVTATPQAGYVFPAGAVTSWTFNDTEIEGCMEVTPAASVTPVCGPDNDVVTAGPTTGVDYAVSGWSNGVYTVTATPQAGYVFPAGATTFWSFTDMNEPCDGEVTPLAPSVAPVCGPDNDVVTVPVQAGVDYAVSGWSNGVYTVTATPQAGYVFPAGAVTFWSFTDANEACPMEVTPVAPTVDPVCGPENDEVNVATTTGVTYTVSEWVDGSVTVTATAQAGYVIADGATTSWTFTDANVACPIEVTPVAPTADATPACGPDNDDITVPTTTGVTYTVSEWVDGSATVTATAQAGYVIADGATTSWTFTDANVACPIEVTPVAPTATAVCGAEDNDIIVLPTVDGVEYTVTSWSSHAVTVTATASAGYVFPSGAVASWTFTDANDPCLPNTGGDVAMPLTIGLGLLLMGGLVLLAARRRAGYQSRH